MCVCLTSWFCRKKLLNQVYVKGRVLHFFTKEPMVSRITLRTPGGNGFRNSGFQQGGVWLTEAISDQNGEFRLRSKPARNDEYNLFIDNAPWDVLNNNSRVELEEKVTVNLGDIFTGEQTIFCKIHLQSVSGFSIELLSPNFHAFAAGTNTTVIDSRKFTYTDFRNGGSTYRINYDVVGLQSFNVASAPIYTSDTVEINVSY